MNDAAEVITSFGAMFCMFAAWASGDNAFLTRGIIFALLYVGARIRRR